MKQKTKKIMVSTVCLCILLFLTPATTAGIYQQQAVKNQHTNPTPTSQSQYWGLLFAVGVYLNAPDMDRPSMLDACDALYDTLLDSPEYWQPSNIHMLQGGQCLLQTLIKELLWLRKNAKSEDYVLVYITTHGNHLYTAQGLPWDLPPKDEVDGSDELLVMYNGFDQWYGIIWDDALNFFLSLIKCKGLCLVVDSCYSGGFNDPPMMTARDHYVFTAQTFTDGFSQEMAGQGRVVLMSSEENTVSFGSYFTEFLIEGFSGGGDANGNNDGINSAEESFAFAKPWTELWVYLMTGHEQHPTIYDQYPGELPVTTS
ncbi:MAG: hypothetical protein JXA00_04690 [Candidatus Thermoplasmatota archaeon]|nr:hypothetical protein [Candidatus Thermoplasmatota archaeon]